MPRQFPSTLRASHGEAVPFESPLGRLTGACRLWEFSGAGRQFDKERSTGSGILTFNLALFEEDPVDAVLTFNLALSRKIPLTQ